MTSAGVPQPGRTGRQAVDRPTTDSPEAVTQAVGKTVAPSVLQLPESCFENRSGKIRPTELNHLPAMKQNQTRRQKTKPSGIEVLRKQTSSELVPVMADRPDALGLYLNEIGRVPLLTLPEEQALARRIKRGDPAAREHMIAANLRLVVKIARDYERMGLPLLDLINEGNIGLMKAVERFDPTRGAKLSTYAALWIKQAIRRALDNQSRTIRLPNHVNDRLAKIRELEFRWREKFDREPSAEEIADLTGLSVRKIQQYRDVSRGMVSLNAPVGADDPSLVMEKIPDPQARLPLESMQEREEIELTGELLDALNPRERLIVSRRFGLQGGEPESLEEVGVTLGLTRERIRQIQQVALEKMRKVMTHRQTFGSEPEEALAA
jgi:RNA polymerase primary sigma factor